MLAPCLLAAILTVQPTPADDPKPPVDSFKPEESWKKLGKNLWFDPKQKRLMIRARIALREGSLEHLLCLENTKEHESILATDAPPQLIHAGLLLTGAERGKPVTYRPKFEPPSGSPIRIDVEWVADGKKHVADARDWVRDARKEKTLTIDWVFAGSNEFVDPETKVRHYGADEGDLFTVANFASAILDLPIASSDSDMERGFVANTPKIPPRGTFVTMVLRPAPSPPKPKSRP